MKQQPQNSENVRGTTRNDLRCISPSKFVFHVFFFIFLGGGGQAFRGPLGYH